MDQIRLVSVYRGVAVPSVLFDSTRTKKIAALASYIIEGIEQGRMLVEIKTDISDIQISAVCDYNKNKWVSPAMDYFINMIMDISSENQGGI